MGPIMVLQPRARRIVTAALAAAALSVPLVPAATETLTPPEAVASAGPPDCVNGVVPLNPYVVNCNLPKRPTRVIGSAPDAGAIIACRHVPICISYYVNYPGTVLIPGYRP